MYFRWLLEFDSFSINETKPKNSRPLTESSVTQRPQWFNEMTQQRRSSETFIDYSVNSFLDDSPKLEIVSTPKKKSRRKSKEFSDKNQFNKSFVSIPKQLETNSEFLIKNRNNCLNNSFKSCEDLLFAFEDHFEDQSNDFIIPELPFGELLVFEIISNWGDEDFVGFNGIEIIDLNGTDLKVEKV